MSNMDDAVPRVAKDMRQAVVDGGHCTPLKGAERRRFVVCPSIVVQGVSVQPPQPSMLTA